VTSIKTSAVAALAILGCAAGARAQSAIYSNGSANPTVVPLSTGTQTGSNVIAPNGGTWSELQAAAGVANATGGFAAHVTGGGGAFRVADDFTVAVNPGWRLDSVSLFAYQSGAVANPFSGVNLRVWNGRPGDAGSTVVFGDTVTNRMTSAAATNIYRAFNTTVAPPTAPDSTKQIWRLEVNLNHLFLTPGHYWLDWQVTTVTAGAESYCPPVTIAGTRTQAGWNARQLGTTISWGDLIDAGKPATAADVAMDLPFVISGFAGNQPCSTDFDGDGDVGTDADIEAFFACLAGNCCVTCAPADFNGDGDVGTDADIEAFFRVLAGQPC
jgi:hypothetical protein